MDVQEHYERYQDAYQYKKRWLGLYQDLYFYVIPNRDAFNVIGNYNDKGKPTTSGIWDNTAVLSSYERANDLHALLMPKDRVWGRATLDPHLHDSKEIDALQPGLDEINDRIMFYLNQSNLARIISSSNLDLIGGTAALWVEYINSDNPLSFKAIPAIALYIEQSTDDLVNTGWYQSNMCARKIIEEFPDYKGTSLQMLKDNPNEIHQVIYGQIGKKDEKSKVTKYYIYAVLESDQENILWEIERTYPQLIVYRDRVRPGEADGRGIGLDLLPTIRDLNNLVRDDRKNKAFKADPPMFYDNNKMFNPWSVKSWSGAMIARQPGQRNPIEALQMPVYPEVREDIRMLQDVIKKGFQVDPLGEINNPVKTATEISIRENRAQRSSSTDIARLINELPKQVFQVAAEILKESQMLTRKRDINAFPHDVKSLTFEFQSPLYDIQNKSDIENFVQNLQLKQQFFGQGAAMATVNISVANNFLTKKFNLPSKLFKSAEEIEDIMNQSGQQEQQAQQAQQGSPTPTTTGSQVGLPQGTPEQF